MPRDTTEPSLDASQSDALVARRDEALSTHIVSAPPRRRWPLWLCILGLGGVIGWQQWQLQGLQEIHGQQSDQLTRRVSMIANNVDNDSHLLGDVDSRLSELAAQVNKTQKAQIESLQDADVAQANTLTQQIAGLKKGLESLADKAASRDDEYDDRFASLAGRIETLALQIEAQHAADGNRDTLLTALQGSVSALESLGRDGRASLAARLDTHDNTLASLASTLESRGRSIDQLDERLSSQVKTLQQLSAQWDEAKTAEPVKVATAADLAAFKKSQNQTLTLLKQQLEQQQHSLSTLEERVSTALTQPNAQEVGGGVDKAEIESEVTRQMNARLATLKDTQSSLSSQLGELRRQQTALAAGLEIQGQNSQEGSDASEQLRSLEASRRQLTGRVASMLSQISQLERRVAHLER